jgi:sulfur carrier protein ThiS
MEPEANKHSEEEEKEKKMQRQLYRGIINEHRSAVKEDGKSIPRRYWEKNGVEGKSE